MASDPSAVLHKGEQAVLVLQGGGALGAYQAGVFEELDACGLAPTWLAGVSIGAINSAIIAGNPPGRRVEHLRAFWNKVSSAMLGRPLVRNSTLHAAFNEASAFWASAWGVPGFFKPRLAPPFMLPDGSAGALSFYDTAPLRETLLELIDFDLLNGGRTRLSLGAVNIKSGNFVYFDTKTHRLGPEHVMASGALPPGLPPVVIDGEAYWDGGIVSNTPLQVVLDEEPAANLAVFQVDLFSASGEMPKTIFDVYEREKEIRFSSRTRLNTDVAARELERKMAVARLIDRLPPELADSPDAKFLRSLDPKFGTTIVHLIYRRRDYEQSTYDYEFSQLSVDEHWKAGRAAVAKTLANPRWKNRRAEPGTVEVLDLTRPGASEARREIHEAGNALHSKPMSKGARG